MHRLLSFLSLVYYVYFQFSPQFALAGKYNSKSAYL